MRARNSVIAVIGAGEWKRLSKTEKADIRREVTRGLDDMKRLAALLSDETDRCHL